MWKKARLTPSTIANRSESVLFFCPSLGEYQAIKPLIELHKEHFPRLKIEVTFFSPSGYTSLSQMNHTADVISYSPFDTSKACQAFFAQRDVKHVIISTLALWPGFLAVLKDKSIPFTFVNARCKTGGLRNLYYRSLSSYYQNAQAIYCSDKTTEDYLSSISTISNIRTGGDPRIKMILDHYEESGTSHHPPAGIIFASIEESEEDYIIRYLDQLLSLNVAITIAPHDIVRAPVVMNKIKKQHHLKNDGHIKVISQMGLLLDLYPRHTTAYIGGGFDKGIHNIAEPLLGGCLVVIGPKYEGDIYAARAIDKRLVQVVQEPSQITASVIGIYREPQDASQQSSHLDWIKEQGELVTMIFEEMKPLY